MALVGTAAICLPLENLKTLLANCPAFQTWTGTANAAAAAAYIDLMAEAGDVLTLPGAVIFWGAANTLESEKQFGGEGAKYGRSGTADIFFSADVKVSYSAYADSWSDLMIAFLNDIGAILDDMDDLADTDDGTNQYLNVTRWAKASGPSRSDKPAKDDWVQVTFRVTWGGI